MANEEDYTNKPVVEFVNKEIQGGF